MSNAKKPLVSSPTSPRSSQMQNVAPSRIVNATSVAEDSSARRLRERLDDELVDVHVRQAGANRTQSAMSSGRIASTPS